MKKSKKGAKKGKKTAPKKKLVSKKPAGKASIIPLGDRVLVKRAAPEEVTSFGLIIPDSAKEKSEQGTVIAVGAGKKNDDGKVVPLQVKVGDRVLFSQYGFDEIKIKGVEYLLVKEDNILAILN